MITVTSKLVEQPTYGYFKEVRTYYFFKIKLLSRELLYEIEDKETARQSLEAYLNKETKCETEVI